MTFLELSYIVKHLTSVLHLAVVKHFAAVDVIMFGHAISYLPRSHVRGQLVNLDPQTLKEREELRRREIKYQVGTKTNGNMSV